jgi:hypothetical protein
VFKSILKSIIRAVRTRSGFELIALTLILSLFAVVMTIHGDWLVSLLQVALFVLSFISLSVLLSDAEVRGAIKEHRHIKKVFREQLVESFGEKMLKGTSESWIGQSDE